MAIVVINNPSILKVKLDLYMVGRKAKTKSKIYINELSKNIIDLKKDNY